MWSNSAKTIQLIHETQDAPPLSQAADEDSSAAPEAAVHLPAATTEDAAASGPADAAAAAATANGLSSEEMLRDIAAIAEKLRASAPSSPSDSLRSAIASAWGAAVSLRRIAAASIPAGDGPEHSRGGHGGPPQHGPDTGISGPAEHTPHSGRGRHSDRHTAGGEAMREADGGRHGARPHDLHGGGRPDHRGGRDDGDRRGRPRRDRGIPEGPAGSD